VFLQDIGSLAGKSSPITAFSAGLRARWSPSPRFELEAGYQPRRVEFWDQASESHWLHPIQLKLRGAASPFSWALDQTLNVVEGSREAPRYTAPGGSPAIGGYAVRDRRDALWLKQAARIQWEEGDWRLRAVYSGYFHDFRTRLRPEPGYCNYIDRRNLNGGVDAGHRGPGDSWLWLGYRYGDQWQDRLFGDPVTYSNHYQRAVLGWEGKPAPWIELAVAAGPTWIDFDGGVPAAFGSRHLRAFSESALTLRPSRADTLQIGIARFEQVSSSGCGAYEDTVLRLSETRTFGERWELQGSLEAHRGEFESPAVRDDWIYTAAAGATWHLREGWDLTARGLVEWSESRIPNTPAREYTRTFVSLGVSATF